MSENGIGQQAWVGPARPSLLTVRCPRCGAGNPDVVGTKGSQVEADGGVGLGFAFGAIGSMAENYAIVERGIAKALAYSDTAFKCYACGFAFFALPAEAGQAELLAAPATVTAVRQPNRKDKAEPQHVFLNGVLVGTVGDGQAVTFSTTVRFNTLFVTNQYGKALGRAYRFEAAPGAGYLLPFDRGFEGAGPTADQAYFRRHAAKFKTWSIVNACLFFVTVLPFFAIAASIRAQNATDKEQHDAAIKQARLLNLGCYAILFVVSVVVNGLRAAGVLNP
jgi:hypothetical protein